MEVSLPEIIDRISILQLKIERVGESHLQKEMEEYVKALKDFERKGTKIKQEWVNQLYEINKGIWDLEWDVRKVVNSPNPWKEAEEKFGFKELGKRALEVERLMKERVAIKNKIVEETKSGFIEKKIDHCGGKNS